MNTKGDISYKRFPLGSLWTNGYLFFDGEGVAFFVDPGGDPREVLEYLTRNHLTLSAVLLTHGHLDHIAGIEALVPLVGNAIYIALEDAPLLKAPPEEMRRALGLECEGIEDFKTVSEGDVLSVGQFEIKVMETPGHTRGSVCYLICLGEKSVLISGDTLFAQSVGRTDLPGGDSSTLFTSLRKLATLPDDLVVLPGHGPGTTIGQERESNPFWP
ncbi:MAG: MBL fold metallo-hydrolase [Synergistaceae bacterium]|jgi:glyoxylase-like metal-dependent hydrolase (beta-lactamase superfamily II)|nr:MBL fold metallo-hydrolase [Synergistaceae bacterium]